MSAPNLTAYIEAHLNKPFVWGVNDCVTFSVGWLNLKTNKNWFKELNLPQWSTQKEAYRAMRACGGLGAAFEANLKPLMLPTGAKDGDIGLMHNVTYLFYGAHIVGVNLDGLMFLNRKYATCAWSV